jgi:hypothetical protein
MAAERYNVVADEEVADEAIRLIGTVLGASARLRPAPRSRSRPDKARTHTCGGRGSPRFACPISIFSTASRVFV